MFDKQAAWGPDQIINYVSIIAKNCWRIEIWRFYLWRIWHRIIRVMWNVLSLEQKVSARAFIMNQETWLARVYLFKSSANLLSMAWKEQNIFIACLEQLKKQRDFLLHVGVTFKTKPPSENFVSLYSSLTQEAQALNQKYWAFSTCIVDVK